MKALLTIVDRRQIDTPSDKGRRFEEITMRIDLAIEQLRGQVARMGCDDDQGEVRTAIVR